MRKCIVLVFLSMLICMTMSNCSTQKRRNVPANEYFIYGKLMNVPDSVVISLCKSDGNIIKLLSNDTLINGEFSFSDTVSGTQKLMLISKNKGFPGTWLNVWIAPGKYIEISGQDKLLKTWTIESDIPEQLEENRFMACTIKQQKELMQHLAAINDWQRMILIDHPGDEEFAKKGWAKVDSIRKLEDPLQKEIWKKEIEYMKSAPISKVWINNLLLYASMLKYEGVMPYKDELKELYTRMSDEEKQTPVGQEITQYIYPPVPVGVGDAMVDGDLYDSEGTLHHLAEFEGQFILLDFWSIGCAPCIQSIPEMEKVMAIYKDKLVVVGISDDPKDRWKEYIKNKGMGGNQWNELRRDRNGLAASYHVYGIPYYVLIAPDGIIQDVWSGYGEGSLLNKMKQNLK